VENARYYSNVFLVCSIAPNSDVTFKITNILKVNNDNIKFNGDFKNEKC
jgi:hypothetical protein